MTGRGMRVGVDGFNMAMARGTGVATYARTLTQCLGGLGHAVDVLYGMQMGPKTPRALREILLFDGLGSDVVRKPPSPFTPRWLSEVTGTPFGFTAFEVPITGRVVASALEGRMPHFDRVLNVLDLWGVAERYFRRTKRFLKVRVANPPAVMHWTYPLPIVLEGARNIYTIHDLVPLRLPYTTLDNKRYYYRLIRGCLRAGDHVCTVSDTSRRDITDLFPISGDRVTNTYQSFAPPRQALEESDAEVADQVRGLFGLHPRGYFLFFGAIEPKKNVGRMIEAYLTSGLSTPLVIVGARSWKSEAETQLLSPSGTMGARRMGAEAKGGSRILQLDYLPISMLMTLVRGAKAVLFPSLYEGFGLPVLEAMALGTPTLTSTEGSLPEVAGDASVPVQPYDVRSIAEGMRRLDGDAGLRTELSARGLVQADRFSMARYQDRVAAMYDAVLAGAPGRPMVPPEPKREV